MSPPRAELVRAFYGFSAGRDLVEALADPAFVEAGHAAFDELATPDFEFVLVRGEVGEEGVYRGPDGVVEGMREWLTSFRSYVATVEDVIDLGERVIVLSDEHGISRTGGVPVRQRGAVIWTFRGDKVARMETYLQRTAALATLTDDERSRLERHARVSV
jgi:ketosteroid isomerase-like protein